PLPLNARTGVTPLSDQDKLRLWILPCDHCSSAQPGIQVFLWHDTPHITEHQEVVGNAELFTERWVYGARRPFLCINSIVNNTDELGRYTRRDHFIPGRMGHSDEMIEATHQPQIEMAVEGTTQTEHHPGVRCREQGKTPPAQPSA